MKDLGLYLPHFKKFVLISAMQELKLKNGNNLYSDAALNLLCGTAIIESHLKYLRQIARFDANKQPIDGVARGLFQCELATLNDIYDNFLKYRPDLLECIERIRGFEPKETAIITNLKYAAAIARVHYFRVKKPMPKADDFKGLANYHKKYYNTASGATQLAESEKVFQFVINS